MDSNQSQSSWGTKKNMRQWVVIGLLLVATTIGLRRCTANNASVPIKSTTIPVNHLEGTTPDPQKGGARVLPFPHAKTKSKNKKVQRARERIKQVRARGKTGEPAAIPLPRPGQP
jgi:hypothetical protein